MAYFRAFCEVSIIREALRKARFSCRETYLLFSLTEEKVDMVEAYEENMKVSNLYISQVKRKCGIEVGKNYNLPENEDSRQPQCPEDKESAIVEALKHFKMNS